MEPCMEKEQVVTEHAQEGFTPVTMSVYTALSKRKILTERLATLLDDIRSGNCLLFAAAKNGEGIINGSPRKDAVDAMKSSYDKATSLIHNIRAINAAIAVSNATTKVVVAGVEYTVASLIYRMVHLDDEIEFLNLATRKANDVRIKAERENLRELSEESIQRVVSAAMEYRVSSETSADERKVVEEEIRTKYIADNTVSVIDPYDLINKLPDMINDVKAFREDVDNALNVSNITTTITVMMKD